MPSAILRPWNSLPDVEVDAATVKEWLESGQPLRLLDVRFPEEQRLASLPGSTLIPLPELPVRWREIEAWKDEFVVIYCHHGVRSLHALHFLLEQGFTHVVHMNGGIDAWSLDVDPTVPRYFT